MSRVTAAALVGVDGTPVEVEVRISSQLPRVDIVGLPEAAVRESAARVRAAITAAGHRFPDRRVTVNLAPAGVRKSGAGLDLPIAVGILAAEGQIEAETLVGRAFVGELALDGRLRAVRGALALALALRGAGIGELVIAGESAREAALAEPLRVCAAATLGDVVGHLMGGDALPAVDAPALDAGGPDGAHAFGCLSEVRGQRRARRALTIAAAGGHGLLMSGPPGAGKTMLARRLPGLLPPLERDEAIEATRVHGASGLLDASAPVVAQRPFRSPHHSASAAGMLGGGNPLRPGEVSLAHAGVLFLDELPEFDRRVLEALREVLEEGQVRIARATGRALFPARCQLVAACNPCPCGWYHSGQRDCRCDDGALARYARRLSGPLLDRIDLQIELQPVAWRDLDTPAAGESSAHVRSRVIAARRRQRARGVRTNALLPDRSLDELVRATPEARALLGRAVEGLGLSARAARRALRVARTCADLEGEREVAAPAMGEALGYRQAFGPGGGAGRNGA